MIWIEESTSYPAHSLRPLNSDELLKLASASIPFLVGIAAGWFEVTAVFGRSDLPVGIGIAVIILASLFTRLWEELLARGVVLTNAAEGLQSRFSFRFAIAGGVAISALLFGLPHLILARCIVRQFPTAPSRGRVVNTESCKRYAEPNYWVICEECESRDPRYRRSKVVKEPEKYSCRRCDGAISIEQV